MAGRTLYEEDAFAWSQRQAELLRDLARTRRDLPNELDLSNIAEEIEDLGRSELNTVLSHLDQMLVHVIKAASRPGAEPWRHWLNEIGRHRIEAERRFTPAMRRQIDLTRQWRRAVRRAEEELVRFDEAMAPMPDGVPFTLDGLLDLDVPAEALVARLAPPPAA
jgi:hypothetical protein